MFFRSLDHSKTVWTVVILFFAVSVFVWIRNHKTASLGQEFTLRQGQTVRINETDLRVTLDGIINTSCEGSNGDYFEICGPMPSVTFRYGGFTKNNLSDSPYDLRFIAADLKHVTYAIYRAGDCSSRDDQCWESLRIVLKIRTHVETSMIQVNWSVDTGGMKVALSGPASGGDQGSILQPGETKQYSFSTYQDVGTKRMVLGSRGERVLHFKADPENSVSEFNEGNNSFTKSVAVQSAVNIPPLTCSALEADSDANKYFGVCKTEGYAYICFNKYSGAYQGCSKILGEGCTYSNTNADENISCQTPMSTKPDFTVTEAGVKYFYNSGNVGNYYYAVVKNSGASLVIQANTELGINFESTPGWLGGSSDTAYYTRNQYSPGAEIKSGQMIEFMGPSTNQTYPGNNIFSTTISIPSDTLNTVTNFRFEPKGANLIIGWETDKQYCELVYQTNSDQVTNVIEAGNNKRFIVVGNVKRTDLPDAGPGLAYLYRTEISGLDAGIKYYYRAFCRNSSSSPEVFASAVYDYTSSKSPVSISKLMNEGIDSISLNPDTVIKTAQVLAK